MFYSFQRQEKRSYRALVWSISFMVTPKYCVIFYLISIRSWWFPRKFIFSCIKCNFCEWDWLCWNCK